MKVEEKTKKFGENVIVVKNLSKKYSNFFAVKDVSFTVKSGEIVGFLGPNGAGKTTTMNILTGCVSYNSGFVEIFGCNVFEEPLKSKKNVGYLPENPPLYQNMTVFEYLKFVCNIKKVKKFKEEVSRVLKLCSLEDRKNKLISTLSKGYKQRVGIAQALVGSPKVLILDEPTSGLDPAQIVQVRELIFSLRKEHTIILSTHILSEIQAVCDKIIIINKGVIVADDSEENLLKTEKESYYVKVFCSDKEKILSSLRELEGFLNFEKFNLVDEKFMEFEAVVKEHIEEAALKISRVLMKNEIPIVVFKAVSKTLEQLFINLIEKKV